MSHRRTASLTMFLAPDRPADNHRRRRPVPSHFSGLSPSERSHRGPVDPVPANRAWAWSLAILVLIHPAGSFALGGDGVAPVACRLVARTTLELLPVDLARDLLPHADALARSASESILTDPSDGFVALDFAATASHRSARLAAVRSFPRAKSAALDRFRQDDLSRVGTLPWSIIEARRSLTAAFEDQRLDAIIVESGRLVHQLTLGAFPLHLTRQVYVPFDPQGRPSPAPAAMPHEQFNALRLRINVELPQRFAARLNDELRVAPDRFFVPHDADAAVFDYLIASYDSLDDLVQTERETRNTDSSIPGAEPDPRTALDHQWRADRVLPLIETRLEHAALTAAGLMTFAWQSAGRPSLVQPSQGSPTSPSNSSDSSQTSARQPPNRDRTNSPDVHADSDTQTSADPESTTDPQSTSDAKSTGKTGTTTAAFVGSRPSNLFHRPDCPHARRIKTQNQVFFSSIRQAFDAGRRPCKTCKPDS